MHRLFETSTTRRQSLLNGLWSFTTESGESPTEPPETFPADADTVPVPCAWNALPEYYSHVGPAWYHHTFHLPEKTSVKLTFLGVAHDAVIYLDGEEAASHYGGYTPVEVVAEELESGSHELLIRADNTRSETTLPLPETDWYPYGGIVREVVLEEVPDVFIDSVSIDYELDGPNVDITAGVEVQNLGEPQEKQLRIEIGDMTAATTTTIESGSTRETLTLEGSVERWSLEDPVLYDVTASVDGDEFRERIGFRSIDIEGRKILLNDEPVELRGVNRHEDHPEWGHAQPHRLMRTDVRTIKDAGLNTIRCSHYPNHPRFLDLCDEEGLLVIEELPYWHYDKEDFERGPVLERGIQMLEEMIERDRHHPSVLAWSVTNECDNDEEGVYEATKQLTELAKDLDGSRPVTFASVMDFLDREDRCRELCDFASINAYWGWYESGKWEPFIDDLAEKYPDKPIVFTEFGAGGIYGERTFEAQKWSEPRQRDIIEEAISTFQSSSDVAGFTIWQYCDTRTDPDRSNVRPKTKNNKGIVDEYRRPKDAYWGVQRLLSGEECDR